MGNLGIRGGDRVQRRTRILGCWLAIVGLSLAAASAVGCDVARGTPAPGATATPSPVATATLTPNPAETPLVEVPLEVIAARDALLVFLANEYPDKAPAAGVAWIGRDTTPPGMEGVSTFEFTGEDWQMTVAALALTPTDILYEMGLDHPPTGLHWTGRLDADYRLLESNLNVAVEALVVRDIALTYVREHYADQAPPPGLIWIGERTSRSALLLHEVCQFTSGGSAVPVSDRWRMTVEFDLVNPDRVVYEVDLRHPGSGFLWRGQVDAEGTVLEHR